MNTESQLIENISIANKSLPDILSSEELKVYKEVLDSFNSLYKVKCTGCSYCMPCPFGVDIP